MEIVFGGSVDEHVILTKADRVDIFVDTRVGLRVRLGRGSLTFARALLAAYGRSSNHRPTAAPAVSTFGQVFKLMPRRLPRLFTQNDQSHGSIYIPRALPFIQPNPSNYNI